MKVMTKRMKLKLLRKFFMTSLNKPIRLCSQHFGELIADLFKEKEIEEEVLTGLMKQAGFLERRNVKGTFYVRPTEFLFQYASKKGIEVAFYFE